MPAEAACGTDPPLGMRDWIALYPSILDSEKWADLPDDTARLAWIVTLLLGSRQPVEGRFDSPGKLTRLLAKEGIAHSGDHMRSLLDAGVLDADGDEIVVRGWDKWQKRWRGPSDDPAVAAERMRRLRADRKGVRPVFDQESNGSIEERRREDREEKGGDAREELGSGFVGAVQGDDLDAVDVFYELTGARAWGKDSGRWLLEIETAFGREATFAALREEHRISVDKRTLISRAEARLAREAEKRRQAVPKVRPKPTVSPEIAARQRAALQGMIGANGGPKG